MPKSLLRVSLQIACILLVGTANLAATEAQARKGFRVSTPRAVLVPRASSSTSDNTKRHVTTDSAVIRTLSPEGHAAATEGAKKALAAEKATAPKTAPAPVDTSINNVVCMAGCMRKP